ncbi:MAG TPA: RNA methyltransferase [Ramlibacter sp.]|jgi:tRNA G18 (ribose-2'-O)-methylase SpoU
MSSPPSPVNSDVRRHDVLSFCTVLYNLQSPQNVGMIVRSHVAFGGDCVVLLGNEQPWRFGKGTQAFSRKLEKLCEFVHLADEDVFFSWCEKRRYEPVALEIAAPPRYVHEVHFPERLALVAGAEGPGLPSAFLDRCKHVVTIPQFGSAESLNVAVACSIAMYEVRRGATTTRKIEGSAYAV